jgi:hypothetical protein
MSDNRLFGNVEFFLGIVEDSNDPTNNARVKVRPLGHYNTWESEEVPTSTLPWATLISGSFGSASQIPRVGEWVFGFFADMDKQHMFIMGTIPGQQLMSFAGSGEENSNPNIKPSKESRRFYGKPPLRPAQGGENLHDSQMVLQNAVKREGIQIAKDGKPELYREGGGWSEPDPAVSQDPAKTTIFSSTHGNSYIEVNGEEGKEHIGISHDSGSHIQIDSEGHIKIRSLGDRYDITESNVKEYNEGRKDVTVEGKYTLKVKDGDATIEVDGDLTHVVHGDYNLQVAGRINTTAGTSFDVSAGRISMESVAEHINILAKEQLRLQAFMNISVSTAENIHVKSVLATNIDGEVINLNSEAAEPEPSSPAQTDLPPFPKIAMSGNQAGMKSINPSSITTGGVGNPGSPAVLDDNDRAWEEKLNLPTVIKKDDGMYGWRPILEGFIGNLIDSLKSTFLSSPDKISLSYFNDTKAYFDTWNPQAFNTTSVAVTFFKSQPVIKATINGVEMVKSGTVNGQDIYKLPKIDGVNTSGTLDITYQDGSIRTAQVDGSGITYGDLPKHEEDTLDVQALELRKKL